MANIVESSERLIQEIKKRAALFVVDNFSSPTEADLLLTESVMLIGASIANEVAAEDLHKETELLSSEHELASEDRWAADYVKQLKQKQLDCHVEPSQDFHGSGGDDCEIIRQQQYGDGTL